MSAMLSEGIFVHFFPKNDVSSIFIEIAPGTECVESIEQENCLFAKQDWRLIESHENNVLRSDKFNVSDIYLISLPKDKIQIFQTAIISSISKKDYQETLRLTIEQFSRSAVSWLNSLGLPFKYNYLGADLAFAPSGLRSTAFDRFNRIYKGLHIDDHEKLPFDRRHETFILFNINLGTTTRYFQFVNQNVLGSIKMLRNKYPNEDIESWSTYKVKDLFFLHHSEYPIIRAVLPPGSAYLCQTQNVIHDGSTNDQGVTDISLLIALRVRN